MAETDNLSLPYILPAQAQKHVTHNEALRILDALVQPAVDGFAASPPSDPAAGSRVLVAANATGAFAGSENAVACFCDGAWSVHAPRPGWVVYDTKGARLLAFDGASWRAAGGTGPVETLGLGTSADAFNRLAVASPGTLLTHEGAGHQLKVNKAAAAETASVLFQTDFSGRAEMGTVGGDDFSVKVSADGQGWREAIRVQAATGRVTFPSGGAREQLSAPRTFHVSPGGSDTASGLSAAHAFATVQRAVSAAQALDPNGHQVTLQLGDGTYDGTVAVSRPLFDGGTLIIRGNVAQPRNVLLRTTSNAALIADGAGVRLNIGGLSFAGPVGLWARFGSVILVRQRIVFGACSARQIGVDNGSYVEILGTHVDIDMSSPAHVLVAQGGNVLLQSSTVTFAPLVHYGTGFVDAAQCGIFAFVNNTVSGTATGPRYRVRQNGVVSVNGAGENALPGSTAGVATTGGQYG